MADALRIMVTNDDGIDSVGLHVLAKAMKQFVAHIGAFLKRGHSA